MHHALLFHVLLISLISWQSNTKEKKNSDLMDKNKNRLVKPNPKFEKKNKQKLAHLNLCTMFLRHGNILFA